MAETSMNRPKIDDDKALAALNDVTWIQLDTIDSTNNFLKNLQPNKLDGDKIQEEPIILATARFQTGGRGQRGNSWESAEGQNVVYSLLVHPRFLSPANMFALSEVVALSVAEGLDPYVHCTVKWPNDIYVGEKKICGILIETSIMGGMIEQAVAGVGVNINQKEFLSDAPNPVSLFQLIGKETDTKVVLGQIIARFSTLYEELEHGHFKSVHQRYMARLFRREGAHDFIDEHGLFSASIEDVEPSGHLILKDKEGILRRYAFKEVSFVI